VRAPPPPPPAPAPEPEPVEADVDEVPAAPAARTSYYAFSDREINALRKRNKKFAKLHSEHKTCAARSEKLITKKGELREQIIELQNKEYRTPKEDRKLASLRKEEHAMKRDKASIAACEPVEEKLTQMLIDAYGTTASM
jgi:colicin import membrane protein